jgi:hypothetical protein
MIEAFCAVNESPGCMSPVGHANPGITALKVIKANEIMQPPKKSEQIRTWVKYIAAPSSSGKTTCMLPAFLKTTLTHYFYIAFDNNQNNNYRLWSESSLISKIPDIARLQGADFMLQCIKRFLDSLLPGP